MNRFYNRQLRNQYVPMSLQEMMVLPTSKTQQHAEIAAQAKAMTNMPYMPSQYTNDASEVLQAVNEFSGTVDQFIQGTMDTGINSSTSQQLKDLQAKYALTKKYVDAGNARTMSIQNLFQTMDEAVKEDPSQADWVNDLKSYNATVAKTTPMDLNPETGEYNSFNFISYAPRPDIYEKGKKLLDGIDKIKGYTQLSPAGFGKIGYLSNEYKDRQAIVSALNQLANDPEVVNYYITAKRIYGNDFKTGLEADANGEGISAFKPVLTEDGELTVEFDINTDLGKYAQALYLAHSGISNVPHYMDYGKGSKGPGGNSFGGYIVDDALEYDISSVLSNAQDQLPKNSFTTAKNASESYQNALKQASEVYNTQLAQDLPSLVTRATKELGITDAEATSVINSVVGFLSDTELQAANDLNKDGIISYIEQIRANEATTKTQYNKKHLDEFLKILKDEKFGDEDFGKILKIASAKGNVDYYQKQVNSANDIYQAMLTRLENEAGPEKKAYEESVGQVIGMFAYLIDPKVNPVIRDDFILGRQVPVEQLDQSLEELKQDLLDIPVSAAAYAKENKVSVDDAQKVLSEEIFKKYESVFNLDEFMANNGITQVIGTIFDFVSTVSDYVVSPIYYGTNRGGEEISAGERFKRSDVEFGIKPDARARITSLKRRLADYATIVSEKGIVDAAEYTNRTTLFNISPYVAKDAEFAKRINHTITTATATVEQDPSNFVVSSNLGLTFDQYIYQQLDIDPSSNPPMRFNNGEIKIGMSDKNEPLLYYKGLVTIGTGTEAKMASIEAPLEIKGSLSENLYADASSILHRIRIAEEDYAHLNIGSNGRIKYREQAQAAIDNLDIWIAKQAYDPDLLYSQVLSLDPGKEFTFTAQYAPLMDAGITSPFVTQSFKVSRNEDGIYDLLDPQTNRSIIRLTAKQAAKSTDLIEAIQKHLGSTLVGNYYKNISNASSSNNARLFYQVGG